MFLNIAENYHFKLIYNVPEMSFIRLVGEIINAKATNNLTRQKQMLTEMKYEPQTTEMKYEPQKT